MVRIIPKTYSKMKKILFVFIFTLSCWGYSQEILSMRDPYTRELTDYIEVKTFSDGSTMTDSNCDGHL